MLKIFISFSSLDEEKALTLESNLRGHANFWIFRRSLQKGKNLGRQLDEALGEADYVICIFTRNYFQSDPSLDEAYSIISTRGDRLVPLFFEELKELRSKRPLLFSRWGISFYTNYHSGIVELLELLEQPQLALESYAATQNPSRINPFGRVRADFLDHALIANTFYEPEKAKYDLLRGYKPVILEGGRGSGKTILLRSLEALPAIDRTGAKTFLESGLTYFGVYIRLDRGSFALSAQAEIDSLGDAISRILFLDDFNLQAAEALVQSLLECKSLGRLAIDESTERAIVKEMIRVLKPKSVQVPDDFQSLLGWLSEERQSIRMFIGKRTAFSQNIDYDGCFSSIDGFKNICKAMTSRVSSMRATTVFLLLDEYENLLESQQVITNTLVKAADNTLCPKFATKVEGIHTDKTVFEGQDIQDPNDYSGIELDYDLRDEQKKKYYEELLTGVASKLLSTNGCSQQDIKKLLVQGQDDKISQSDLENALGMMLETKGQKLADLDEKEKQEKITYYKVALTYRALRAISRKGKGRQFSGFETYVYLSSGIIRLFMELCGMAFYLVDQAGMDVYKIKEIPLELQSRAVYNVSEALLESIAHGIEEDGIKLQRLVIDLGDIFRTRLLYDNNEPETIRIGITNSRSEWPQAVSRIIKTALNESVFHKISEGEAMRPKASTSFRPSEFLINRIYTPALEIGYGARWRSNFSVAELDGLMDPKKRSVTKHRIISKIMKSRNRGEYGKLS